MKYDLLGYELMTQDNNSRTDGKVNEDLVQLQIAKYLFKIEIMVEFFIHLVIKN